MFALRKTKAVDYRDTDEKYGRAAFSSTPMLQRPVDARESYFKGFSSREVVETFRVSFRLISRLQQETAARR